MGCKFSKRVLPNDINKLYYDRIAAIKISIHDSFNNIIGQEIQRFVLKKPKELYNRQMFFNHQICWISGCVLPGMDPRGLLPPECQDEFFIHENLQTGEEYIVCSVFDGHGTEGAEVVRFCKNAMKKYFTAITDNIQQEEKHIENIINQCDETIKHESSQIDVSSSGTSCVLALVTQNRIITGSVGKIQGIICQINQINSQKITSRQTSYKNLTYQQLPENKGEYDRIIEKGGRVQKLTDEQGNKWGPYRIWLANQNVPGLPMSRSIGDKIGSSVGIISKPIIVSHNFVSYDQFIVLASDGVWEVMSQQEVVDFVEKYRRQSNRTEILESERQSFTTLKQNKQLPASDMNISQMLCEEARVRWFEIVAQEDVMFDDISAVILELKDTEFIQQIDPETENQKEDEVIDTVLQSNMAINVEDLKNRRSSQEIDQSQEGITISKESIRKNAARGDKRASLWAQRGQEGEQGDEEEKKKLIDTQNQEQQRLKDIISEKSGESQSEESSESESKSFSSSSSGSESKAEEKKKEPKQQQQQPFSFLKTIMQVSQQPDKNSQKETVQKNTEETKDETVDFNMSKLEKQFETEKKENSKSDSDSSSSEKEKEKQVKEEKIQNKKKMQEFAEEEIDNNQKIIIQDIEKEIYHGSILRPPDQDQQKEKNISAAVPQLNLEKAQPKQQQQQEKPKGLGLFSFARKK